MKDFPGGPVIKSPHFPTHILIDRWMDKETVVHIHNEVLLSYKKCICVSSNEVDDPRAYYQEWSKSEREWQYHI